MKPFYKNLIMSTSGKSNDPESNNDIIPTRILGTVLMVLSGVFLYFDKIISFLNINFPVPPKFAEANMDMETFIWLISSTVISPLFIILGFVFKPYKISIVVPIYCYCLQAYFILLSSNLIDEGYLWAYAFGTTVLIIVIIDCIKRISKKIVRAKINKEKERLKNLYR